MNFINSKKIETLLIIKDFIIIFYFYNYQFIKVFNNISNQVVIYSLISFWLLFKYILGQYERKHIFNTKELLISLSCNTLILLLANIIYFFIFSQFCFWLSCISGIGVRNFYRKRGYTITTENGFVQKVVINPYLYTILYFLY